jgi:hypothetical protein
MGFYGIEWDVISVLLYDFNGFFVLGGMSWKVVMVSPTGIEPVTSP